MQYTDQQLQDLVELRALFGHKLGQLAGERDLLLGSLACKTGKASRVCDRLNSVAKWADLLRENGAEEHRCYLQIITASCRGVRDMPNSRMHE